MKNNKLICSVLLFLTAACIFAGGSSDKKDKAESKKNTTTKPEWITNPNATYSETSYITGVGSAKNLNDSQNDAVAAIGKVLNQSIQSEEQTNQSFSSTSEGVSTYLSQIKTSTSLTELAGVSIKETWTDEDSTVYSLALLNKTESGQYYKNKIDQNNTKITELLSLAQQNEGSFTSCSNAVQAYELAKDNDYYLSLLAVIKPVYSKTTIFDYGSSNSVAQKVSELLSSVNVLISVQGDSSGQIASAFASALSNYGIKTFGGTSGTEDVRYALMATISYEPVDMPGSNYAFVRYIINTELIDNSTGKNMLPWTKNSRIGKLSQSEAQNAAARAAIEAAQNEYSSVLSAILE